MTDFRPVAHIIGLVVAAMGALMLLPALLDWAAGSTNWAAFVKSAFVTVTMGVGTALATANATRSTLDIRQIFLITTLTWVAACAFGALPFVMGAPGAGWLDAVFEATSGLTTTGSTVFVGLDALPPGVNLWRVMLHWLGGLGIVIVAMLFLPVMKVGGMQFFRSEGFDTLGKVLPRALDISSALVQVYVALTLACAVAYLAFGMSGYDAVIHALSTISTGGFSSYDSSFAVFAGPLEWVAIVFMIAGCLPFVRLVQVWQGEWTPIWEDRQVRAFLRWVAYAVAILTVYAILRGGRDAEVILRETAFNTVSIFTGTGLSSADIGSWGPFAFTVLFLVGLIGGCTSSTGCSVKVFRWLILWEAVKVQLRRIRQPDAVNALRYGGRPVSSDVLDAVIFFFAAFVLTFGLLAVALTLTGLNFNTAVTAAWTAIANVGPAFGPEVHPTGALLAFPAAAKVVMILGMLFGRLELLAVFVLFLPRFWRD